MYSRSIIVIHFLIPKMSSICYNGNKHVFQNSSFVTFPCIYNTMGDFKVGAKIRC